MVRQETWSALGLVNAQTFMHITFQLYDVLGFDSTSVFVKVYKRVSRWNFRVSTPFSLLCLILLTDFQKNARFYPNTLNYLNTTFTFGKQTEDNFTNIKVG